MSATHHCHHIDRLQAGIAQADANQALFPDLNAPAKPRVAAHAESLPEAVAPYSTIVETDCEDCGGTGSAGGKRDEYDPCHYCGGSCKQAVLRNWLGEAFQIEAGMLKIEPKREHLAALRHYAKACLDVYMETKAVA